MGESVMGIARLVSSVRKWRKKDASTSSRKLPRPHEFSERDWDLVRAKVALQRFLHGEGGLML